jgi:hypothetical protein
MKTASKKYKSVYNNSYVNSAGVKYAVFLQVMHL